MGRKPKSIVIAEPTLQANDDQAAEGLPEVNPEEIRRDAGGDTFSSETTGGEPPRQRKPRGPYKKRSPAADKADLTGIADALAMATGMLAGRLRIPELELNQAEGKAIDAALTNVANQYDFAIFGAKSMAWLNLGMCVSTVAGSHYYMYRERLKYEKARALPMAKPTGIVQ